MADKAPVTPEELAAAREIARASAFGVNTKTGSMNDCKAAGSCSTRSR